METHNQVMEEDEVQDPESLTDLQKQMRNQGTAVGGAEYLEKAMGKVSVEIANSRIQQVKATGTEKLVKAKEEDHVFLGREKGVEDHLLLEREKEVEDHLLQEREKGVEDHLSEEKGKEEEHSYVGIEEDHIQVMEWEVQEDQEASQIAEDVFEYVQVLEVADEVPAFVQAPIL